MITAIEIENFKGIGEPRIRIELRPITLLFGANSAGKSTIFHALHYAHEILSHRNFDPNETQHSNDVVNLGGFRNFVHRHDLKRTIRLRFELNFNDRSLDIYKSNPDDSNSSFIRRLDQQLTSGWVELRIRWATNSRSPIIYGYEVAINGKVIGKMQAKSNKRTQIFVDLLHPMLFTDTERKQQLQDWLGDRTTFENEEYWNEYDFEVSGIALPLWDQFIPIEPRPQNRQHSSDVIAKRFGHFRPSHVLPFRISTLLVAPGQLLRDELMNELRHLGPMRELLPRTYAHHRYIQPQRWAKGLGAWDLMFNNRESFINRVSHYLSDTNKIDTGYKLSRKTLYELPRDSSLWKSMEEGTFTGDIGNFVRTLEERREFLLTRADGNTDVHPSEVGIGISQIVPVIVAALDPERPNFTAIEQPELHMHPKAQVGLGDLFASQITDDSRCFLIETHSEHLMLRLLRRIEETNSGVPHDGPQLLPEQVSVVFIEQIDGQAKATQLRIDEEGEFINRWPHGFFEERAKELF